MKRAVRIRGAWTCIAALLLAAAALPPLAAALEKVKIGDKLPDIVLKDTAGAEVKTADTTGKARVIVLFKEGVNTPNALKRLGKAEKALKDKGVVFLGVYFGKGAPAEARALADAEGATFPVLMGSDELYGALGIKALPSTIFVDKEGKMVHEVTLAPFQLEQEATEYALVALGEKTKEDAELALRPQDSAPVSKEEAEAKKMYGLAMVLMERGLKDKAVAKLQEILKLDPGFCDAHILLGHVYLDDGKVEEAIAEFTYVIKCDPSSNDAKLGLGMAHAKKGDLDKALEYYQGALQLNPKPEKVYYEMGRAWESKGDVPKALESYKAALKRLLGAQ